MKWQMKEALRQSKKLKSGKTFDVSVSRLKLASTVQTVAYVAD